MRVSYTAEIVLPDALDDALHRDRVCRRGESDWSLTFFEQERAR